MGRALAKPLKVLAFAAGGLALAYVALCAVLFGAMSRPPAEFGRFMAAFPKPLMAVIPFRPLWLEARAGDLQPGDLAPDFELPAYDKSGVVRLGGFRGQKPVVLVFGSYT